MTDKRRITRLDEGASIWKADSLISTERLTELKAQYPGFYRLNKTVELSGKSRSQVYKCAREGSFPMWKRIGENSTGWLAWEVQAWIESRPYACDETSVA